MTLLKYNAGALKDLTIGERDTENGKVVRIIVARAIGPVVDSQGTEYDITSKVLDDITVKYNARVDEYHKQTVIDKEKAPLGLKVITKLFKKSREDLTPDDILYAPLLWSHNDEKLPLGHVLGKFERGQDSKGVECIFADACFTDEKNAKLYEEGKLDQVSPAFTIPDHHFQELSCTNFGAIDGAVIMGAVDPVTRVALFKKPDEKILQLKELKKELDNSNSLIKCKTEALQKLAFKMENKKLVHKLICNGKILAKYREKFEAQFDNFSSAKDRDFAIELLNCNKSVINEPRSRNTLALAAKEIIMNAEFKDKIESFDSCESLSSEEKKLLNEDPAAFNKLMFSKKKGMDPMEKHIHGDEHNADFKKNMEDHIKNGRHKEAIDEYCKYNNINLSESKDKKEDEDDAEAKAEYSKLQEEILSLKATQEEILSKFSKLIEQGEQQ